MKKTDEQNHAERNASGWMDTINEQVAALEMDWERYEELKDMDPADMTEGEKEELAALKETAGDFENADDARERIEESPLSVEVRTGWHTPGGESKPDEFMILLSTGGPALRIVGDLDDYMQPERCRIEYQDWGTPWTEYFGDNLDRDTLETWARVFYFGE
jgi:hypothetical protein